MYLKFLKQIQPSTLREKGEILIPRGFGGGPGGPGSGHGGGFGPSHGGPGGFGNPGRGAPGPSGFRGGGSSGGSHFGNAPPGHVIRGRPGGRLGGRFHGPPGSHFAPPSHAHSASARGNHFGNSLIHSDYSEGGSTMNQIPEQKAVAANLIYGKLVTALAVITVFSNILAAKVWTVFGLTFDGGLLTYPLTFLTFDLICEIFDKESADRANNWISVLSLVGFGAMVIVNLIPSAPGTNEVALSVLYGDSLRVIVASVISYWVSHRLNNRVHGDLFSHTSSEAVRIRSWLSTAVGQIPDTVLFNTIAFAGRMSFFQLLLHMLYAYVAALLISGLMSLTITKPLRNYYLRKIQNA